jgi:hypothetical protein
LNTRLKIALLIVIFGNSFSFYAQDFSFKNFNWDENVTSVDIPAKYKDEKEVILDRDMRIEFVSDKGKATQYYLLHEKVYINSDDAVERNNKIYIPFGTNESVLTTKARVILKNGKVIVLDSGDIKVETDEERGMKYNYFAVNGLEKGAVIEKIFIIEEAPDVTGRSVKMQDEYPIAKNSFQLIYPNHLIFKTKSYNGLAEATITENKPDENRNTLTVAENDTPALENNEQYANWTSQLKTLRYKLDENLANGGRNLYNFKEFSTTLYERFHPVYTKKEQKAIDDFCSGITKSTDEQEQIWNIEDKIKKTVNYGRYIDSQEGIQDILKTKQANQSDILRLYIAVFTKIGVENNLVLTSDRYKTPFDKDFESFENVSELLFYFPNIKKFLSPTEVQYRIPLFPNELGGINGLFIKEKTFAGMKVGIGDVGFIDIPGKDITHDVMDIAIDFSKDPENPTVTDKLQFGGYSAVNFQSAKDFISAEQYKTVLKDIAKSYTVDTEYTTLATENDGTENIGKKPFVLNVAFNGKDLVQKAGDNYLFSVGQTIGKQMELYQENKRVMPVEIDYPHSYTRTVKLIVPEGATVKNLEKFNMDFKCDINGETQARFASHFERKGNEITIENTEYYNVLHYPLEDFEAYRAVINAAADFNKIVIVISR